MQSCSLFRQHAMFESESSAVVGMILEIVVAVSPCYPPFGYLGNFVSGDT